jgi:hypothetical protein
VEELADGKARTLDELRKAVGARRDRVKDCLEQHEHLFRQARGEDAGRPRAKVVWLAVDSDPPDDETNRSRPAGPAGPVRENSLQTGYSEVVPSPRPPKGDEGRGSTEPVPSLLDDAEDAALP